MITTLRHLFEVATSQQDYAWFCVLLTWASAAFLVDLKSVRAGTNSAMFVWIALTIAGGLGLAGGELVMHAWPPHPFQAERIGWDRWLSVMALAQTLALLFPLAAANRRGMLLLAAAGLIGVWLGRHDSPLLANTALAVAAFLLALAASREVRRAVPAGWQAPWVERAILLAGLTQLLGTTGLLSEVFHQQRRWTELSFLGLPSAAIQFMLAACVVAALDPRRLLLPSPELPPPAFGRDVRNHLLALSGWLLFGLVISWFTGRAARSAFEQSLVARARAASAIISPVNVRRILGPRFKLQDFSEMRQDSGRRNSLARVPALPELDRPTADELTRVEDVNPGIHWAHLVSLRDGYLVSSVFSSRLTLQRDSVSLLRPVSESDWSRWYQREAFFEGPIIGSWGELVRAYAPLVHPEAGMLGWVALDFGVSEWTAAQALARLQSFVLTAAGGGILILLLVRRLRELENRVVREQAAVALAADRTKTAFLAKVSHELRTPVQSILGYGELLAGLSLSPEPQRWLGAVRTQGQLLIRLVNDLLDLSAMQAGAFRLAPRPTDLVQLVGSCVDSLRPRAAARGLTMQCETDPATPPWLDLDPERVRQILFNLLGNAIKFTDAGEVTVRLCFRGFTDRPGAGRVAGITLVVADTGPGISPEQQAVLFRPFSRLQAHADREGAGLGLALTAALCTSMQGSLRVSSNGMQGSEFTATLDFLEARPSVTGLSPAGKAATLAGRRILVADDNALVRELYLVGLRSAGAWCEAAADGLEAVDRCASEVFDAVVLDVSMPWLDGMESARRIRSQGRAGLRIIGVSAHAGTAERELGLAAGMDVFLVKPVSFADLFAAVAGSEGGILPLPEDTAADLALLRRLRTQFAGEAPRLMAELNQAAAAGDRRWLATRAHYLKNSSDVTGYPELSLLCSRTIQLAGASHEGTRAELTRLVREITALLSQLIPNLPSLSSESTDDSQKNH